jgi:uncharacterized phage-associated protein
MSYDGREVANFILDFCDKSNRKITHLSLQKIVYFCHVWSIVKLDKPLVKHKFEAWEFGPVLQYLYRQFKPFDRRPIDGRAMKINAQTGQEEKVAYGFDEETQNLLNNVVEFYSRLDPRYLVYLSHEKNGPWDKVWNHDGEVNPGMVINNEEISLYYSKVRSPV